MDSHGESRPRKRANRKKEQQRQHFEVPEPEIPSREEDEVKLQHSFSEEEDDGASLTYKILFFVLLLVLGGLATIVLIDGNNSYELKRADTEYSDTNGGLDEVPIQVEEAPVASSWFDWLTNEEEDHDHHHVEEFTDEPHEFHDDHDDEDDSEGGHGPAHEEDGEEPSEPVAEGTPEEKADEPEDFLVHEMELIPDVPESNDEQIPSLEDDVNNLDSEFPELYDETAQNVIQDPEEDQVQDQPLDQQEIPGEEDLESQLPSPPQQEGEEDDVKEGDIAGQDDADDNEAEDDFSNAPQVPIHSNDGEPQAEFYAPASIQSELDEDDEDEDEEEKYYREQVLQSMGAEQVYQDAHRDQFNQYQHDNDEDIFDAHEYM